MSARVKARKRALEILFSADVRGDELSDALAAASARAASEPERASSWAYAREIVDGVIDHKEQIDAALVAHSHEWKLERMPAVDRAALRIAGWEILYNDDVPDAVAINEAVELVKELSTDESGNFVNGVLRGVAHDR